METHRLVRPKDLNQYGHLFGGRLLSWVDEASWIAASLEFPEARFVTMAMDEVVFRNSVKGGSILTINSQLEKLGQTSATYKVNVMDERAKYENPIFTTRVTFVNVNDSGQKIPLEK